MRTLSTIAVALALLAGCASTESKGSTKESNGWTKVGTTEDQMSRDRTECLFEARTMTPNPRGPRMTLNYPMYERCMEARGYTAASAK